jgi:hypothetical protein
MKTLDFLRRVTGDAGYYCTLGLGDGVRKQKFYSSHEDMLRAAELMDENGLNAYFALGTFLTDRNRKADNVELMRALYLDLDCGPEKDYPDQHEAMQALRRFVKATSLPKPLVVNSGRGLHVYWPLTEPVTTGDWMPVATRLKAACAALNFPCDTTATTDAARVLRVPGTHNHKDNPPKPVAVLMDGDDPSELSHLSRLLAPHAKELPVAKASLFEDGSAVAVSAKSLLSTNSTMEALMGNFRSSFKLLMRKTAEGKGCAQIGEMVANPADVSEPLWRSGLSIAVHCEEEKAIHWISKGHPEYDPRQTEVKARAIPAPHSCATFNSENKGICTKCPFWGKIKSPIVLGREFVEADEDDEPILRRDDPEPATPKLGEIPKYPSPYVRGKAGGVYIMTRDEDGAPVPQLVWGNDLYVVRRLTDPEMGEIVEMRHHLPRDGIRSFVVPLYTVTSKEEFRKALAMQGVAAINKEVDTLMAYTQAWVKELQQTTMADTAHRQYGWLKDFEAFVVGEKVISAGDTEYNAPSSSTRSTVEFFEQKGTLDGWKTSMNFYNRKGFELHQLVVCAGFGSALMKFMPVNAAMLHLWSSDSGFGKTTALMAALSIWGDPVKLLLSEKDTFNSKMNRADVMHNLPVCMDEITNIRPSDASDMIYQITGGQQRNRLSANGNTERYRGDPWNLLFITTGNSSIIDKVALAKAMPKAEAQRVLEIEVSKLFTGKEDKEVTDKFSRELQNNYGHAGEIFVKYVIANRASVDILVSTVQRHIDKAARLGPENRFWSAAAAVSIAAAVICNHLGLLKYDVKNLQTYVVKNVLQSNQSASGSMQTAALPAISEYVYHNWGRILQIRSTATGKGLNGNGVDQLVVPEQLPKGIDIVGRYETDKKMLYLLAKPLRAWLAEQQLNFNSIAKDLCQNHAARQINVKLTRGTTMNLPAAMCLSIDTDRLPIELGDADSEKPGSRAKP